ncbi:MAG TPA: ChbG/HpnK family deacetylase [Burkholderiales bacterium]|nr:ChbG/HpnK family deacetylase [Burkholderiales bacterium]
MLRFILNADDYAFSPEVDDGIICLAEAGLVTSVSVLASSPRWPSAAARLAQLPVDVGLHLDLTSPYAASASNGGRSVVAVMRDAWARRLDAREVRRWILEQCRRFEDALGQAPVFVDGHQHVHQFPVIRDVLLDVLEHRYANARPHLRLCRPRCYRGLKATLIGALGGAKLTQQASARGFSFNSDFAGVYAFGSQNLQRLWAIWLTGLSGSAPLIMCHVARADPNQPASSRIADRIHAARLAEYAWLSSDDFAALCEMLKARPVRWTDVMGVRFPDRAPSASTLRR